MMLVPIFGHNCLNLAAYIYGHSSLHLWRQLFTSMNIDVCNIVRALSLYIVDESINKRDTMYGKPKYFDIVKTEYTSCRENVCLVDMSSFAKVEIRVCY